MGCISLQAELGHLECSLEKKGGAQIKQADNPTGHISERLWKCHATTSQHIMNIQNEATPNCSFQMIPSVQYLRFYFNKARNGWWSFQGVEDNQMREFCNGGLFLPLFFWKNKAGDLVQPPPNPCWALSLVLWWSRMWGCTFAPLLAPLSTPSRVTLPWDGWQTK